MDKKRNRYIFWLCLPIFGWVNNLKCDPEPLFYVLYILFFSQTYCIDYNDITLIYECFDDDTVNTNLPPSLLVSFSFYKSFNVATPLKGYFDKILISFIYCLVFFFSVNWSLSVLTRYFLKLLENGHLSLATLLSNGSCCTTKHWQV